LPCAPSPAAARRTTRSIDGGQTIPHGEPTLDDPPAAPPSRDPGPGEPRPSGAGPAADRAVHGSEQLHGPRAGHRVSAYPPAIWQHPPTTTVWNDYYRQIEPYDPRYNSNTWGTIVPFDYGPDVVISHWLDLKYPGGWLLVKCGWAASSLGPTPLSNVRSWLQNDNDLWPELQRVVRDVEAAVVAQGRTPVWSDFIWHQWETNAIFPQLSQDYGIHLATLVTDTRVLLRNPALEVWVVGVLRHPEAVWDPVRAAQIAAGQAAVARADPLTRVVRLDPSIPFHADHTHRTPLGVILEGFYIGGGIMGVF